MGLWLSYGSFSSLVSLEVFEEIEDVCLREVINKEIVDISIPRFKQSHEVVATVASNVRICLNLQKLKETFFF